MDSAANRCRRVWWRRVACPARDTRSGKSRACSGTRHSGTAASHTRLRLQVRHTCSHYTQEHTVVIPCLHYLDVTHAYTDLHRFCRSHQSGSLEDRCTGSCPACSCSCHADTVECSADTHPRLQHRASNSVSGESNWVLGTVKNMNHQLYM